MAPVFGFACSLTPPEHLLLSKGRGRRKKRSSRAGVQTSLRRYRASTFTPSGTGPEQVERCLQQVSLSESGHGTVVATSPLYDLHYSRAFPTRQAQTPGPRVLRPVCICWGSNGAEPLAHTLQSAGVGANLIRVALLNTRSIANKAYILNFDLSRNV
ncbi:hypothetical protein Q8A73_002940 [Channa argus]|nr:hypothetical protein Q8A73_002940 [Channa argus]